MSRRRLVFALAGVVGAGWLAGLVWFAATIPSDPADTETVTDAIVVPTGGSLRIQSGLALLAQGKAKKLFVSGVEHTVDLAALLHAARQPPEKVACCIVLGHAADNTRGNARETAEWMRKEGFHSLRLVTSGYHMRRSLLEFRRRMPDVAIIPHPILSDYVRQEHWWSWGWLVFVEYDKYLVALARQALHRRRPRESRGA
jgi:uncharacterized SAM-binding protein YcdF (DUF218 family)